MKLPTEIFGDVLVAHAPDELGCDQAEGVQEFLTSAERAKVVLDMDGLESIDSVGLEALLDIQRTLQESDGDLKISTTNNTNRKILEITRLDTELEVFTSVIDAVRSYC